MTRLSLTPSWAQVVARVAMTYLPGIAVLAFTKAPLIQIFFRLIWWGWPTASSSSLSSSATWIGPPCPPWGRCPVPDVPPRRMMAAFRCPLLSSQRPSAQVLVGDTTADTEGDMAAGADQGVGLALSNACFEDKDKEKDKAMTPRQG